MIKITDEFNISWWVAKGDPAWDLVGILKKCLYTLIILPRYVIIEGVVARSLLLEKLRQRSSPEAISRDERKATTRMLECIWELLHER